MAQNTRTSVSDKLDDLQHVILEGEVDKTKGHPGLKVPVDERVNMLISCVAELVVQKKEETSDIHEKVNTLMDSDEQKVSEMGSLKKQISDLQKDRSVLQGLLTAKDREIEGLKSKVTQLQAKNMQGNFTVTGLGVSTGDPKEHVFTMLRDKMLVPEVKKQDVLYARFLGNKKDKNRPIQWGINPEMRPALLANFKNLKGSRIFVNEHMPEQMQEERRVALEQAKKWRAFNEKKPKEERVDIKVKGTQLYIDQKLQKPPKRPRAPEMNELMGLEPAAKQMQRNQMMAEGEIQKQDDSTFRGYAVKVKSLEDMRSAQVSIRRMYPSCAHVVTVARIKGSLFSVDDGEYGAGFKLERSLKDLIKEAQDENRDEALTHLEDVCVLVVRFYGGVNLGGKRFNLYRDAMHSALEKLNNEDVRKLKDM